MSASKLLIICALVLLSACGGGGGGEDPVSPVDERLARLDDYAVLNLRVLGDPDGMTPTPVAAVPDTGTAVFGGFATIRVERPGQDLVLYGDTTVSIDFSDNSVDGTMDRFFGTDATGSVVDYSGVIAIDSGAFNEGLWLGYAGVLAHGADELVFDGTMMGGFLGNPLAAISAADLESAVVYNGEVIDATVIIVGEVGT
ncbi:hypothetical protein [Yoonia maritima]|uniref:hypothetical protein n=1 Tax=Yoonia maritima TaxID=1435347 RepID=UPI0037358B85